MPGRPLALSSFGHGSLGNSVGPVTVRCVCGLLRVGRVCLLLAMEMPGPWPQVPPWRMVNAARLTPCAATSG